MLHCDLPDGIRLTTCVHEEVATHTHDFLELVYVEAGAAVHTLRDVSSRLEKGQYFLVDYGVSHRYVCEAGERITIINCLFRPEFLDRTLRSCHTFHELADHYLLRINTALLPQDPSRLIFSDGDGEIYRLMCRMRREYDAGNCGFREILRAQLIEVIVRTIRKITASWEETGPGGGTDFLLRYVREHYSERVSLTALAARLSYSVPYLSQRFRRDTGKSFTEYLQHYRILQSARLLLNGDAPVTEVAAAVGYGDGKFFGTLFRRYMHMAPLAYRKQGRGVLG